MVKMQLEFESSLEALGLNDLRRQTDDTQVRRGQASRTYDSFPPRLAG